MGHLWYMTSASSLCLSVAYLHNLLPLLQKVPKRGGFFAFLCDCTKKGKWLNNVKDFMRNVLEVYTPARSNFLFTIIENIPDALKSAVRPCKKWLCAFPGNWTRDFGIVSTSYRVKLFEISSLPVWSISSVSLSSSSSSSGLPRVKMRSLGPPRSGASNKWYAFV